MHYEEQEQLDLADIYSAISIMAGVILEGKTGSAAHNTHLREIVHDFGLKAQASALRAIQIRAMDDACATQPFESSTDDGRDV